MTRLLVTEVEYNLQETNWVITTSLLWLLFVICHFTR